MRYAYIFITAGLIFLLAGEAFGIWMGVQEDFTHRTAHAHVNLVGGVSLILYGLVHRAFPALAASRLAGVQMGVALLGAIVLPAGIYYVVATQNPAVAIAGSFIVIAGTLTFLVMFARRGAA